MLGLLIVLGGTAVGFSALLYFSQDRLIFHPQPAPSPLLARAGLAVEEVEVRAPDGIALRGWLSRPGASSGRLPLVIYFGGNAEEVSGQIGQAAQLDGWALLAVNYRGYGGNPGQPSEANLLADSLALHEWAVRRPDIDASRIVAMGRSLGSGVAVYLASQRPLAGVVLVTPYDSLRAVAQRHYPFAPVSLLLRHSFDSVARAPRIQVPALVLAARRDTIVPVQHARVLFDRWAGPKAWREFPNAGHNDLDSDPDYWREITAFLAQRR